MNYIIIFIIFLGVQKIELLFWVRDIVTFPKQQSNKMSVETQTLIIQKEQQGCKQPIMVPPMRYYLQRFSYSQLNKQWHELMASGAFPTRESINESLVFMNNAHLNSMYGTWSFGFIPAPPHNEITKRVIGKNGYYFKMTTTVSDVEFIWHDRVTNTFLFWGTTNFKVVKAMNAIRWRIHKVYATPPPPPPRLDSHYEIEDISHDEEEEKEEEESATNNEKVIRDIMEIHSLDRKGAEEKIDEMAKNAVVKHS